VYYEQVVNVPARLCDLERFGTGDRAMESCPLAGTRTDSQDALLAEQVRQGDRRSEDELVARYAGRVLAMAIARTLDRESSREIADDVMMAVVAALRRGAVRDTTRLGAFVHGTAVNTINNHLRRLGRGPRMVALDDSWPGPVGEDDGSHDIDVAHVHRCLERLSAADRDVLTLSLVEGLKPAEIAARCGRSAEATRQQKSRALLRLRQLLCQPTLAPGPA
jgi:RNA polymerase sigma-70 factor (ECF subfamily)